MSAPSVINFRFASIRRRLRRPLVQHALVLALAAETLGLACATRSWARDPSTIVELASYLGLFLVLAAAPPIARFWRRLDSGPRVFVAALIFLMLAGQVARNDRQLFPLAYWHMYSHPAVEKDRLVVEYVGLRNDGRRERIEPATALPSLGRGTLRIANHLDALTTAALADFQNNPSRKYSQHLGQMLTAIGGRCNERRADSQRFHQYEVYVTPADLRAHNPLAEHRLVFQFDASP